MLKFDIAKVLLYLLLLL